MWEYKVINTRQAGVPMSGDGNVSEQVELALNRDFGDAGWELCGCPSKSLWIFKRRRPRRKLFVPWGPG